MLLFGGPLKLGTIQILLKGAHLNWLAKIKLRGTGLPGTILLLGAHLQRIGGYLNISVGGPFKLVGKN